MKITLNDLASFVPSLRQAGPKTLLHVGCGNSPKTRLPECFQDRRWREVRLDIDPNVNPDIVASLVDMSAVPNGSIDAVWSSHNLEHLESFQVPDALNEIHRVLKPGGFALIALPDLEVIAKLIYDGKIQDVIYHSPAGPITPLDMLFGHQKSIRRGNHFMAHRTGFTSTTLLKNLTLAGFTETRVTKGKAYDLWAVSVK